MVDALSYGLFGKSHRNIKKGQLINSVNQKDMLVEVEFSVGNSEYKVIRGQKPNKFEIWRDGTLINQSSHAKKYQKILEQNIIKHNHKSFHQVEVLGSSSFVPFMKLPSWTRREVIEDLLDMNVFSRMNAILKERMSDLKDRINENHHDIELLETKIDSQEKHINVLKRMSQEAVEKRRAEIEEYKKEIEENQQAIDCISVSDVDSLESKRKDLASKLKKIESYLSTFRKKIRDKNKEIEFYSENNQCPTCEQEIDEDFKQSRVDSAGEEITTLNEGELRANEEIAKIEAAISEVNQRIDDENKKLQTIQMHQSSINTLQKAISKIQTELESIEENDSEMIKAKDILKQQQSDLKHLNRVRHELSDEREYNLIMLELLKDTGIKTKIVKEYLPVINTFVNKYLQVLDFYVHFELDEEFKESIKSRHRDEFSYDSFSEGEKQKIDMALLFTWRQIAKMKNSVSTNLLILDETFDASLDPDGVENLLKLIETQSEDSNIFIISHKMELLESRLDEKIVFEKRKNFSGIV